MIGWAPQSQEQTVAQFSATEWPTMFTVSKMPHEIGLIMHRLKTVGLVCSI